MSSTRWHCVRLLVFVLLVSSANAAVAQSPGDVDPLFRSQDALDVRLVAPINAIKRERSDEEELDGTLRWTEADGREVEVAVKIRARGNYRRRRDTCPFPPLRLNFKTSEVEDTLFDEQDKVKLVSHCRDGSSRYEQAVLREWLTYRMFNAMTDLSYRVRLLRITYEDSDRSRQMDPEYAFFIESKERLSARTGLSIVEIERSSVDDLDPAYTNLTSIFQYMIGNTDFSPIAGAEGEICCHNVHLYSDGDRIYPILYDFDMSGMIDAPYSSPNPKFNLRNVKQRLYRGRCAFNAHLPDTIQAFKDRRDALYALVGADQHIHKNTRRALTKYLDSFFAVIDSAKNIDRKIIRACLG